MSLSSAQIEQRRKAAASVSQRKAKAARQNGKLGGRPGNPAIKRIMSERGVTRQRAHQILQIRLEKL